MDDPKNPYEKPKEKYKWRNLNRFFEENERTHVQENNLNSLKPIINQHQKLKTSLMEETKLQELEESYNGDLNTTCRVCGKFFPSIRSLSGHMRTHPERQWRGIQPLKILDHQNQNSSSFNSGKSDLFDLSQNLKNWGSTGKRGMINLTKDDQIIVEGLLNVGKKIEEEERSKLSLGFPVKRRINNSIQETQSKKPKNRMKNGNLGAGFNPEIVKMDSRLKILNGFEAGRKTELHQYNKPEVKPKNDEQNGDFGLKFNLDLMNMDSRLEISNGLKEFYPNKRVIDQADNICSYYNVQRNYENLVKRIHGNGKETPPVISNEFKCNICHKSFSSYQALGGHKSGHKNCKDHDESSLLNAVKNFNRVDELQELNVSMVKSSATIHQCKICNMSFSSGQALGGHQRRHRVSPLGATISSEVVLDEAQRRTSLVGGPITSDAAVLEEARYRAIPVGAGISSEVVLEEARYRAGPVGAAISSEAVLEEAQHRTGPNSQATISSEVILEEARYRAGPVGATISSEVVLEVARNVKDKRMILDVNETPFPLMNVMS